MKTLIDLFLSFFKIGLFTFGGGYAMLPMIQREIVEKREYVTEDEVMDYYALSQLTPGVIAVNCATFTGCKVKGKLGGAVATAGVVAPSFIIITIIALVFNQFADLYLVKCAFAGIRCAVLALMVKTIIKVVKTGVVDKFTLILLLFTVALMYFKVSSVIIILICALAAVIYKKAVASK